MKKLFALLFVAFAAIGFVSAGDFITANDLEDAALTTTVEYDGVELIATSEKGITIENLGDDTREAEDGEIFNARIKLNGGGNLTSRAIKFTSDTDNAELVVYLNSSSKTDARTLIVANEAGEEIATLTAPADNGIAGFATCTLPEAGEYYIYSKSSGINIYMLYC